MFKFLPKWWNFATSGHTGCECVPIVFLVPAINHQILIRLMQRNVKNRLYQHDLTTLQGRLRASFQWRLYNVSYRYVVFNCRTSVHCCDIIYLLNYTFWRSEAVLTTLRHLLKRRLNVIATSFKRHFNVV